jgi:hypothetical protein
VRRLASPVLKRVVIFGALFAVAGLVSACAVQPHLAQARGAPGFFFALLHGFIAPVSLIGGIFLDIRIYAFPNSGWFYDLGFLLGLSVWGGGAAAAQS